MTTASELKSAAVVEVENEVRKTDAKTNHNALDLDERCSRHDDTSFRVTFFETAGSTTATATSQVALAKAKAKAKVVSGSKAATTLSTAASMQAIRLSAAGFPQNSRLFPIQRIPYQKNPALLGQVTMPERFLRARSAA